MDDSPPRSALRKTDNRRDDKHVTFQSPADSPGSSDSWQQLKQTKKDQQRKRNTHNNQTAHGKKHKFNQNITQLQQAETTLMSAEESLRHVSMSIKERRSNAQKMLSRLGEAVRAAPSIESRKYSIQKSMATLSNFETANVEEKMDAVEQAAARHDKAVEAARAMAVAGEAALRDLQSNGGNALIDLLPLFEQLRLSIPSA